MATQVLIVFSLLKWWLWTILPKSLYIRLRRIYHYYIDRPKRMCYGNLNKGKKFYVIRKQPPGSGLFFNYLHVLGYIKIANAMGCLPVVDMENYETYYREDHEIYGTKNAWEYYFLQPSAYTLSEVYKSNNVYLSPQITPYATHELLYYKLAYSDFSTLSKIAKEQTVLNERTSSHIADMKTRLFPNQAIMEGILGVHCRGTDYTKLSPHNHAIQPTVDELIHITKEKMNEWNMGFVYLATEEAEAVRLFEEAFRERLIVSNSMRHEMYDGSTLTPNVRFSRDNDKYISGLEYLTDIMLLVECDGIVSTLTGGAYAALLLNGGRYKHKHIIDLGVY